MELKIQITLLLIHILLLSSCFDCKERSKEYETMIIKAVVLSKYRDSNHDIHRIKLDKDIILPSVYNINYVTVERIPNIWEKVKVGDSLIKLQNSLEYKIKRKNGEIRIYEFTCDPRRIKSKNSNE